MFARALLTVAAAALVAACPAGPSASSGGTATPRAIALERRSPSPGTATACMAALLTGALVRDGEAGIRVLEQLFSARYAPAQRLYWAAASPMQFANVVVDNDDPSDPHLVYREPVRP